MDAIESLIDKRIRQAMDEGLFDNLTGAGRPIADLHEQLEPGWWAARLARRERSKARAEDARDAAATSLATVWSMAAEHDVRDEVDRINAAIDRANVNIEPHEQLSRHDADRVVAKWRALRAHRNRARTPPD